jgi:hypothetical protein
MNSGSRNQNTPEEDLLNRLVRDSRRPDAADFKRPDGETIAAYLMGTATPAQEEEVRAALLQSPAFRREILDMAEDMDLLAHDQALKPEGVGVRVRPPSRSEFLRAHGEEAGRGSTTIPILGRLLAGTRVASFIYQSAVAAALVLIVTWLSLMQPAGTRVPYVTPLMLKTAGVEVAELTTNKTRSIVQAEGPKIYESAEEAALGEFRLLLEDRDGMLYPRSPAGPQEPAGPHRMSTVILLDSADEVIGEFRAPIPISGTRAPNSPQAWFLALRSRNTYTTPLRADTTYILWPADMEPLGVGTITYGYQNGYKATVGFALVPR